MKILLIGLGSIGTRHLRNILSLGYKDVSIVSRGGKLPEEFSCLKVYSSVETALSSSAFDAAIICNPTSKHVHTLQKLLVANIENIYAEKPVGHSLQEIEHVLGDISRFSKKIIVGYDLHFDPGYSKVKELLDNNKIGQVISVNAIVGQYLPDWRPHEDYREGMSAKKETGGGVMLDLIHEFDYLFSLFGKVRTIASIYKHSGALEIETEDIAEVLLQFESGCLGTIHLDYLQHKLIRNCTITGSGGTIIWNLADSYVSWIDNNKIENDFHYKSFERNDRFVAIMKAFLENKGDERLTTFSNGVESLRMVEAAKQSSESNQFISLNAITFQ